MFPSNPFSMVVWIVLIACAFSLAKHYIDARQHKPVETDSDHNAEIRDIISRLEHRIVVLERIVTDSGYDLKREIDNL
ncbi:MAG: hypothetical protein AAAFM81_10215 [Pseudomonadota bacterium]